MAEFTANPTRFDPYKNFRFRVKWDGQYVAGFSRASGLIRTTEVVTHREGGDPSTNRKSPGLTDFAPIVLERGITFDTAFEAWANQVWQQGAQSGAEVSANFRKDIVIDLYNEAGQLVHAYRVLRCWPSQYLALPDLDAQANGVVIEHLTLENEGWERDTSVVEQPEPEFPTQ